MTATATSNDTKEKRIFKFGNRKIPIPTKQKNMEISMNEFIMEIDLTGDLNDISMLDQSLKEDRVKHQILSPDAVNEEIDLIQTQKKLKKFLTVYDNQDSQSQVS